MRKTVYLASPYSCPPTAKQQRYELAFRATVWGWKKGYLVFSPIAYTHRIAEEAPEIDQHWRWMEFDLKIMNSVDELWVLMDEGWIESIGVQEEIQHAKKLGIPIRYIDPKEIDE